MSGAIAAPVGAASYPEAEAIGLRGTGIGCLFGDILHHRPEITDTRCVVMYPFTVGGGDMRFADGVGNSRPN